jgi:NitT/TauT family transport system substrate-binding protein
MLRPLLLLFLLVLASGCRRDPDVGPPRVNLGYFPNVTHAQALVGIQRGDFAEALGPDVAFRAVAFNAGPSVIEALYAGELDMAYVGPSPIINGFLKSDGEEVRVVAGSAENGIVIVGNKRRGISTLQQLKGRTIATPQVANTQDISARYYITQELGSPIGRRAGETTVIPISNADILNLFQKDQLDAAWIPEPWASRMEQEGLVVVIAEEKDLWEGGRFALTSVIARRAFLEKRPELVAKVLGVHARLTQEIAADPNAAIPMINARIEAVSGKRLPVRVLEQALTRCTFTTAIDRDSFARFFEKGRALRYYRHRSLDLDRLIAPEPLP